MDEHIETEPEPMRPSACSSGVYSSPGCPYFMKVTYLEPSFESSISNTLGKDDWASPDKNAFISVPRTRHEYSVGTLFDRSERHYSQHVL